MQKYDVAIIGGGASGLACAVSIKERAPQTGVIILEAAERLGKKLAATGNGQGNITNADMGAEHFHGSGKKLAKKLCSSGLYNPLSLFNCLFTTDRQGRVYPAGRQASSLSDCLVRKVQKYGIEVLLSRKVSALNSGFVITLSDGEKIAAKRVVLAAGGCAQKQFFTDGNAFNLAKSFSHTVTPLYPSLVQLKCGTQHIKTLKGIRADCAVKVLSKDGKTLCETRGDVIFTDYGVSGNAIFYASSYCAGRDGLTLSLEFLPDVEKKQIISDVSKKAKEGYPAAELLSGTLHNQLGRAIIRRANTAEPEKIAALVKAFTLPIEGTLGFDLAQVTKGGVLCDEVTENLESKLAHGLYFTGEVLDVDGDCGGYNLTWAIVSGMHVGAVIASLTD